jgi:hypothetical protein
MSSKIKASYSQISCYKKCPQNWAWSYKHKYKPIVEKASTFFGNYVESACLALLEGKSDYKEIGRANWESQTKWNHTTKIENNPAIVYSNQDMDPEVLTQSDKENLFTYAKSLGLEKLGTDAVDIYREVKKHKSNPHKHTPDSYILYFSKCSWVSLLRKGELLTEAFRTEFLPRVERVISLQEAGQLTNEDGTVKIIGYIDMVLKLKDYPQNLVLDLKTSSGLYQQSKLDTSEQLGLYLSFVGRKYETNTCGYVVLNKNIAKVEESFCTKCGCLKTTRHESCANMVSGKRCGGTWHVQKKLVPEVQVLISEKEDKQIDALLEDYSNVVRALDANIIYKNVECCENYYGSECPFKKLCFTGSEEGLIRK